MTELLLSYQQYMQIQASTASPYYISIQALLDSIDVQWMTCMTKTRRETKTTRTNQCTSNRKKWKMWDALPIHTLPIQLETNPKGQVISQLGALPNFRQASLHYTKQPTGKFHKLIEGNYKMFPIRQYIFLYIQTKPRWTESVDVIQHKLDIIRT